MSFYPDVARVTTNPNSRVAVKFHYTGNGKLSNPTSSCSCTTPSIQGKNVQMYIDVGSWSKGSVTTKYAYVKVDGVQHTLPVEITVV